MKDSRTQRQLVGIDKWFLHNCEGTLKYYTGFGKSRTTCALINKLLLELSNEEGIVLILVEKSILKTQWQRVTSKAIKKKYQKRIRIETIQYVQMNELFFDNILLLVVDEIHKFYSVERLPYLQERKFTFKCALGLSATPQDQVTRDQSIRDTINKLERWKIIDEVSRKEGELKGWCAEVDEYVLEVPFTDEEQLYYDEVDLIVRTYYPKFASNNNFAYLFQKLASKPITLSLNATHNGIPINYKRPIDGKLYSTNNYLIDLAIEKGWSMNVWKQANYNPIQKALNIQWNPYILWVQVRKLKEALVHRNELIWKADNKIDAVVDILKEFPAKKTIIFNQRIEFADRIKDAVLENTEEDCKSYHSKIRKKKREEILDSFINNEFNVLSTVSSANEGMDIEDLELGISVSGVKNPNTYTQTTGRIRSKGLFITLCCKDSKEEEDIIKRTKNSHVKWINDVKEINDTDE